MLGDIKSALTRKKKPKHDGIDAERGLKAPWPTQGQS